jgi:hypothetical protein
LTGKSGILPIKKYSLDRNPSFDRPLMTVAEGLFGEMLQGMPQRTDISLEWNSCNDRSQNRLPIRLAG